MGSFEGGTSSARRRARLARQLPSRLAFVTRDFAATFAFFKLFNFSAKVAKVQSSCRVQSGGSAIRLRVGAEGLIEMSKSGRALPRRGGVSAA
jgi:hypothetical protein